MTAHYRLAGRTVRVPAAMVRMSLAYPNGRDCGAGGPSGEVTLGPDGLR